MIIFVFFEIFKLQFLILKEKNVQYIWQSDIIARHIEINDELILIKHLVGHHVTSCALKRINFLEQIHG